MVQEEGPRCEVLPPGVPTAQIWRKDESLTNVFQDDGRESLAENLFFFCSFGARLGGHESGSDNHADKGQGDEQIVHFLVLLGGF